MTRGRALLAALVAISLSAAASRASKPEWSKPYLKNPVPEGPYIAKADDWVVLHGEAIFSAFPDGRMVASYRLVLGATGSKIGKLELAIDYDEGTERLVEPQLLVPGGFGYREVSLKRSAIDMPHLRDSMVGSGRFLFLASRELLPSERAIVSWQVEDQGPYPGASFFSPFFQYPAAELVVRVEQGAQPLALLFCEPQADGTTRVSQGEKTLHGLPARGRVLGAGDAWKPHPRLGLPFFIALPETRKNEGWGPVAQREAAFFDAACNAEDRAAVAGVGSSLAGEGRPVRERAAALCAFVQGMTYRNVAWGAGAYTPEPPRESLRTLSADCKGKVVLLRALLAYAGVESVPVLCYTGETFVPRLQIPQAQPFNHVVLAVHLPGAGALPGALSSGPGAGWLLFDPTDPLAALGKPLAGLEGTTALWLGSQGEAFEVHTVVPSELLSEARLRFHVENPESAAFDLTFEGFNPALGELAGGSIWKESPERFRERCQKYVLGIVPGASVESARFDPPDHASGACARLEIRGRVPGPLQAVGGRLYACLAPAALAGAAAGIPRGGYQREDDTPQDQRVTLPEFCRTLPGFQGRTTRIRAQVQIEVPAGWSVQSGPSPRQLPRAPWVEISVTQGPPWAVDCAEPRGAFGAGTEKARVADLNAVSALFRKPFVLQGPETGP